MSNRLFQSVIYQMKDAAHRVFGVIDENGMVIACSDLTKIGELRMGLREEFAFHAGAVAKDGYSYRTIGSGARAEYAVFVEGESEQEQELASVVAVALNNLKGLFEDRYDRNLLIKNILLDNILPGDVYIKAKQLRFETDVPRAVFVIRFHGRNEMVPYDMVANLFPDKKKDCIISIGTSDIVLVRDMPGEETDTARLEKLAYGIADTLAAEFYVQVSVGIGQVAENIKDLAKSYKEAQIALEVGKIFDGERNISSYENLGIGRLIYQLPATLCEMFLQEVFKRNSVDSLDRESLSTVRAFFENNLNVSETARQMFVHRNTLVYRIEKIKKITGLDLREFDQAITFKVAMMVRKYLSSRPDALK